MNRTIFIICSLLPLLAVGQSRGEIEATLRPVVLKGAERAMGQSPVTVTSSSCDRSAGTIHDFYSEGDYWWPDTKSPDGPYVRRDGQTNPDNFVDHRRAVMGLGDVIGSLASAYILTGEDRYVSAAMPHLRAWFMDTTTMMNPSLLYAQAIKGVVTGRGIGLIDTIHFMEVVQGVMKMEGSAAADKAVVAATRGWFTNYLTWLTTHPYGVDEMNAKNNHGTCWAMQAAAFARFTGNAKVMELCRDRYKNVLLPSQIAVDGSFPLEMARTKPYGYALFNLDAMAALCHILSDRENDMWEWSSGGKPSLRKGVEFMAPYIANKSSWPLKPDVMYWDQWPVAHPSILFASMRYKNSSWFDLWRGGTHSHTVEEVVRNMPLRNPLIWL